MDAKVNWTDYSQSYNAAFITGLKIQAVLGILTALILDFGVMHRMYWIAMLSQWMLVWILLFRRPRSPTRLDLQITRYGIIPLFTLIAFLGPTLI